MLKWAVSTHFYLYILYTQIYHVYLRIHVDYVYTLRKYFLFAIKKQNQDKWHSNYKTMNNVCLVISNKLVFVIILCQSLMTALLIWGK